MTLATRADLTSPLDQAAHDAVNAVGKATDQAVKATQTAAHDALASARDMSQQLTNAAQSASDQAVTYIKKEPVTAMLVAAAVGAVLMGFVAAIRFSSNRS